MIYDSGTGKIGDRTRQNREELMKGCFLFVNQMYKK